MRVSTNVLSMVARRRLQNTTSSEARENMKLSSGDRIYQAAFDPSGLAISEGMRAKVRSNFQAQRNANDGVSLIQVAEGALSTVQQLGVRLRELAVQSASDTLSDSDRYMADSEFQNLKNEIKRIISSTEYNGKKLLDGSSNKYDLQIGTNNNQNEDRISYDLSNVMESASNLGLESTSISSKYSSQSALSDIDKMIGKVSHSRAKLGSFSNRLESAVNNLQIGNENTQRAKSKIRDTDLAESTAKRASAQIQSQAATKMLNHVNSYPKQVQKLLD